jgi:tRNA (cmo5U34)-methyltransferase
LTDTRRFDQIAPSWDADVARVKLAQAVADAVVRQCRLGPNVDVLDYGCGTGLLTLALLPLVRHMTGADTSIGMLDVLKQKALAQASPSLSTLHLSADDGYALSGQYDLIVSSMALHHVADLPALFARFRAHLRPGGWIGLADLDLEDGTFHGPEITDVFHPGFDRGALRALLAKAGFDDLSDTTAFVHRRNDRDYPVFLITGRVGGHQAALYPSRSTLEAAPGTRDIDWRVGCSGAADAQFEFDVNI